MNTTQQLMEAPANTSAQTYKILGYVDAYDAVLKIKTIL
jgi:hypothetical protein